MSKGSSPPHTPEWGYRYPRTLQLMACDHARHSCFPSTSVHTVGELKGDTDAIGMGGRGVERGEAMGRRGRIVEVGHGQEDVTRRGEDIGAKKKWKRDSKTVGE